MRIQEYATGSRLDQKDLLLGSKFIEKGKYKNKNFALKDIISHVKAGLPKESGTLSIQLAIQDETDSSLTPSGLINRHEEGIVIPEYGLVFVQMIKNANGDCVDIYLFTRNGDEFGENAQQSTDADFIKISSHTPNEVAGSFISADGKTIQVENGIITSITQQ